MKYRLCMTLLVFCLLGGGFSGRKVQSSSPDETHTLDITVAGSEGKFVVINDVPAGITPLESISLKPGDDIWIPEMQNLIFYYGGKQKDHLQFALKEGRYTVNGTPYGKVVRKDETIPESLNGHSVEYVSMKRALKKEDFERFASLSKLELLDLRNTNLSNDQLANLKSLTQLKLLDLGGTDVSDKGLVHLHSFKHLRTLDLRDTNVTNKGVKYISHLSNLRALFFGTTRISDRGLRHLKTLPKLQFLDLRDTDVTDQGMKQLQNLDTLRTILLGWTDVGNRGLLHLAKIESLQLIDVMFTSVDKQGVKNFQRIRPNCKVDY